MQSLPLRRIDEIGNIQVPSTGTRTKNLFVQRSGCEDLFLLFRLLFVPCKSFSRIYRKKQKKTTGKAIARIVLSTLGWEHIEEDAFDCCKNTLKCQVSLTISDIFRRLCSYKDALDLLG